MEKETHSPRGRINLVKMAADGTITMNELADSIDVCLGCRACETACPSGVEYGKILEETREVIQDYREDHSGKLKRGTQSLFFTKLVPRASLLQRGADVFWMYQRTGMQRLFQGLKLNKLLPAHLAAFESILPEATSPKARRNRPAHFQPQTPIKQPQFRIAFFTGCIMDAIFERINRLSMELLAAAGCEVVVIQEQACCGALHAHAGRMKDAKELAKKNIEAFESLDVDYIVNNAGGCGAMLVEYDELFAGDTEWEGRAHKFTEKTRDISEILDQCELPLMYPVHGVVTYQPSCHMLNVQKVVDEPLSLIKKIPGIELKELENAHHCCGSAGIYNVVHYEESMEILDEKMKHVQDVQPNIIVTTNPGCLLQMKLGVEREGQSGRIRTVHLVELLSEAAGINI